MSNDRTRWRSHVGLPSHVIQDVTDKANRRDLKNIPRANDSNVKPKIIYVSRNASVRDDTYRSELYIPKRSLSYESGISKGKIEIPLTKKIVSNGGLQIGSDVGFSPIGSTNAIDDLSSNSSPPPPPLPATSPPPLIPAQSPPHSPPPPPLPTSSPPPLDDDLPPPPLAVLTNENVPGAPPSPTPSFHGNHINLALAGDTAKEEEIMRYMNMSIAKENIVISETTQSVDSGALKKGDNSNVPDKDSFYITRWDGKKVKTVRAYIKPGTVEELRELFLQLGLQYGKTSNIERRKARRMLLKKRGSILDGIKPNIDIKGKGIVKSDSLRSDSSAASSKLSGINDSNTSLHAISPQIKDDKHLPMKLPEEKSVKSEYNFKAYQSPPTLTKVSSDNSKTHDLLTLNINKDVLANGSSIETDNNILSTTSNTNYLGQSGFDVTSSNATNNLTGSYSSVWSSNFEMTSSQKTTDDTNGWVNEEETPVLASFSQSTESHQRHSVKDSSEKSSLINENMDGEVSEPDELDDNVQQGTADFTHVTDSDKSSASSSDEESREDRRQTVKQSTISSYELDENRPTSPKEQYDNLISELKKQTSLKRYHVTGRDISEANSETSSAIVSVDEVKETSSREAEATHDDQVDENRSQPQANYGNLINEFKSVFMRKNFSPNNETKEETSVVEEDNKSDKMPVLSGSDDLVTPFNIPSSDVTDFGNSQQQIASTLSDILAASTSSQRSSRSMNSSSVSSLSGSGVGSKSNGDIIMVEGSNGSVYMVEDLTDTAGAQESFSRRSSRRSSGRRSVSGGYQIGSTGNLRIDSNVDNETANEIISAMYKLNTGDSNSAIEVNNNNNNQKALSLRSSQSSSGSGIISLPGKVSYGDNDDNNVTQDVKEHETVTIHGVTEDNVALIEHRVQKTITRRKDVEESAQSVSSSVDNELTIDTASTEYDLENYNQGTAASYNQPMLVTTQEYPAVSLGNSTMKTFKTSILVPGTDSMVSSYNMGNLNAPPNSLANYNGSAFQIYNQPNPGFSDSSSNANITTITNNYVTTTTEYTMDNTSNNQVQTNYVKAVEPTEISYNDAQAVLNNVDNVTRISNSSENTSKHAEEKDNETNIYTKKTVTTTILPSVDIDSVYGSKSSRTTSDGSPRDDDWPLYRVVSASMSPRRSPSPKRRTIYHDVGPRIRSLSPKRHVFYEHEERQPRSLRRNEDDYVYRTDYEYRKKTPKNFSRPYLGGYDDRLDEDGDDDLKLGPSKIYVKNRRKSSGFNSSDSDVSDRNVKRYHHRVRTARQNRVIHGYQSDDEVGRLYQIKGHGKNGIYERSRPESVMSDDQMYRVSSPPRMRYRSPSPDHKYKIVRTSTADKYENRYQDGHLNQSPYKATKSDSGYFEQDYISRTTRVTPSLLSPSYSKTQIQIRSPQPSEVSSMKSEPLYKVVNVQQSSGDKMSKSRRRRSRSSSESSNDDTESRKYRIKTTKASSTTDIRENGFGRPSGEYLSRRSLSPTLVADDRFRITRTTATRSQEPIYRARSPSPARGKHRTLVDVRRDNSYRNNISKSYSDLTQNDHEFVVRSTRASNHPMRSHNNRSESYLSEHRYRMRSPEPVTTNLSYRGFLNDVPSHSRSSTNITSSGGLMENISYRTTDKRYKVNTEPQAVEPSEEQGDLKVVRGQILIKNKIDTSKDEDDFDDNVNIFDNYFHLQKDNPLYQSDPDIYKSFEEETITKTKTNSNLENAYNNDITFEAVENIAKTHQRQGNVSSSAQKKQNLSQLLLSKLEKIDPKDIRQNIDVKHTNEEIFGEIEFITADGSAAASNDTKNFDSVSENVDLTLRDGKAFIIITVNAERIVPIDFEFNVWRKSAAIVTRQIEIDLFANDQRRRLYQNVMEKKGTVGALGNGSGYRRNSRTGETEKVLNSMETLQLFTEILNATDGEGDFDETSVQTRQLQGQGQLPANEEIDFLY